jgi:hypothetical protein
MSIVDAPNDGIIYGRKDGQWVDLTGPANLQIRRGSSSEIAQANAPLEGEPLWSTDTKLLYIGDNTTIGGVLSGPLVFGTGIAPRIKIADSLINSPSTGVVGIGALDLQTSRSENDQIASAQYSFVTGRNNKSEFAALGSVVSGRSIESITPYEQTHGEKRVVNPANPNFFYDIRSVKYFLRATTFSNSQPMSSLTGTPMIPLRNNYTLSGTLKLSAHTQSTASDYIYFERRIVALNINGIITLQSFIIGEDVNTNNSWTLNVNKDDNNQRVIITVSSPSSNAQWYAIFDGLLTNIYGS